MFKYKINIFASLQETTLVLTHVGQKAVARTKQRLYFKFWWTGMNQSINYSVRKCYSWQVVTPVSKKTPLQMTLIPNDAWLVLGCNFCGLFPSGEVLSVYTGYYSCCPAVEILHKKAYIKHHKQAEKTVL